MTTIRDIARQLNLSVSAVSHALNGYPDISNETRQRVLLAVQEMGYTPNQAARQLRGKRVGALGYILPAHMPRFSDPFYSEFIAGLGDESASHQVGVLITSARPGEADEQRIYQEWVQAQKVDGFILNRLAQYDWRVRYLFEKGFPFVGLENSLDGIDFPRIEVDSQAGMHLLVRHLVERGFRRLAFIGGPESLKIQHDRLDGYRQALAEYNLPQNSEWVQAGDLTSARGYELARKLLAAPTPPDGIVCINDQTAFGVLHALNELGYEVGRAVALTGFDGVVNAEHTQPPLTTLNQPVYEIARRLVQMLLGEIGGQPACERSVRLQPELVARASTAGRVDSQP
jgi:LacI family transcriptional regulator